MSTFAGTATKAKTCDDIDEHVICRRYLFARSSEVEMIIDDKICHEGHPLYNNMETEFTTL